MTVLGVLEEEKSLCAEWSSLVYEEVKRSLRRVVLSGL